MVGTASHPAAKHGRMDDTMMAHVARGEQIVPKPVLDANPHLAALIAQAISDAGADPEQYRVGENMSINPETNLPEFGFFSRGIGRILKSFAGPIVGALTLNPVLGAAVGAGVGATGGGGVMGGLTGAAGGYFGSGALSGAIKGFQGIPLSGIGPVGPGGLSGALSGAMGGLTSGANSLGSMFGVGGGTIDTASKILQAGSIFGAGGQKQALATQKIGNPSVTAEVFTPKRPDAATRPASLNELSGYSPEQERSALATRGVNTGLGNDEQSYYRNLIQRSLIGDGGQVNTSNPNFLLPIESSYFSRQGLNTSDQMQFLRQLHS